MSLSLCDEMTRYLPYQRPNCQQILKTKKKWALNRKHFKINYEMLNNIITRERENKSIIYLLLRSEFNLFKAIESKPIPNSNTTRVHNCVIA